MKNLNDIWRDISRRIQFYTYQTSKDIPDSPGLYAWYLPLWLYKDNISALHTLVESVHLYDSEAQKAPESEKVFEFNWASYLIKLGEINHSKYSEETINKWNSFSENEGFTEAFKVTLMEASILLPPLYVGRTNNLKNRYSQHITPDNTRKNNFHNRFYNHTNSLNLKLKISDLIYCCITSKVSTNVKLNIENDLEYSVNDFIEQIILKLAKPPFSLK